jgi:hypothetical protein
MIFEGEFDVRQAVERVVAFYEGVEGVEEIQGLRSLSGLSSLRG